MAGRCVNTDRPDMDSRGVQTADNDNRSSFELIILGKLAVETGTPLTGHFQIKSDK
ncbi:hypothetical protein ADUPG1_002642, partial [Aduncisulcus paluster]